MAALSVALSFSLAGASGSVQLQAVVDQKAAFRNGEALAFVNAPHVIGGRTMLPLREAAAALGQSILSGDGVMTLGRLSLDARTLLATLGGAQQPAESVSLVNGVVYVSARLLADALGANLSFSDDGRTLTLTALPPGGNPLSPQARFSTDKTTYAPGERVIYTEYAFDPDGSDLTSRRWAGRQDVYFQPGTYPVSLQVTNARGLVSQPFVRSITVTGQPIDTPLSYALKYAAPGDTFADSKVLTYPAINASSVQAQPVLAGQPAVNQVQPAQPVSTQPVSTQPVSTQPVSTQPASDPEQPVGVKLSGPAPVAQPAAVAPLAGGQAAGGQAASAQAVSAQEVGRPLLFSDSPEAPAQSGILYQDSLAGPARLLSYHVNALAGPARLYVVARNLETRAVEVKTERLGETAPTRIEGLLGQVTLLEYFASSGSQTVSIRPGESVAIYASPTLGSGSGVNMMQDIVASGRIELTFAMLEDGLPPSAQVLQQLPFMQPDGRHQRGTFPNAVRSIKLRLTQLPARVVIGDGQVDPALTGTDALTRQPQRLIGNYGVLYDIQVQGAAGTAVALSPRGGLYRGAMNIHDGPVTQAIKLPRSGGTSTPDSPTMLWRPVSNQFNISFVPASGSNLPISLVFYRASTPGAFGGVVKRYTP